VLGLVQKWALDDMATGQVHRNSIAPNSFAKNPPTNAQADICARPTPVSGVNNRQNHLWLAFIDLWRLPTIRV